LELAGFTNVAGPSFNKPGRRRSLWHSVRIPCVDSQSPSITLASNASTFNNLLLFSEDRV
jgi:hypothetical protein